MPSCSSFWTRDHQSGIAPERFATQRSAPPTQFSNRFDESTLPRFIFRLRFAMEFPDPCPGATPADLPVPARCRHPAVTQRPGDA